MSSHPEIDAAERSEQPALSGLATSACSSFVSPFGYTHPDRDRREMCPYCYNEDTRRMVGLGLAPYEDYHSGKHFKAFECAACNAKFHFSTNGQADRS